MRQIDPVLADLRLSQLLAEDELLAQAPQMPAAPSPLNPAPAQATATEFTGNAFEDVLARTVKSLEGVSQSEAFANQLVEKYIKGEVDLQEVMVAQSKVSVMVQLAVTTINNSVNTFKELTAMQV